MYVEWLPWPRLWSAADTSFLRANTSWYLHLTLHDLEHVDRFNTCSSTSCAGPCTYVITKNPGKHSNTFSENLNFFESHSFQSLGSVGLLGKEVDFPFLLDRWAHRCSWEFINLPWHLRSTGFVIQWILEHVQNILRHTSPGEKLLHFRNAHTHTHTSTHS